MATIPPDVTSGSLAKGNSDQDPSRLRSQTADDAPEPLCLLDDAYARSILIALVRGPRSGRALAERCDISRPTAYRRLNRLEEAGFVTTELCPDPDGHHRTEFSLARDRLTVVIEDGSLAVTLRATDT